MCAARSAEERHLRAPTWMTGWLSTLQGHENVELGMVEGHGELRGGRRASSNGEEVDNSWIQAPVSRVMATSRLFRMLSPFRRQVFIVFAVDRRRQDGGAGPRIIELSRKQEGDQEVNDSWLSHSSLPIRAQPEKLAL